MNNFKMIHETALRDIIDVINSVKDFDQIKWMQTKNNVGSIAKRSSDLILVFPVLVSNSLSIKTATIISKAIERKCSALLQILFASINMTSSKTLQDYISQFHTNLNGRISMDDLIEILDGLNESGEIEVINKEAYEAVKEAMNDINHYLSTEFNPVSINEFKSKTDFYGNSHIVMEKTNSKPLSDDDILAVNIGDLRKDMKRMNTAAWNTANDSAKKAGERSGQISGGKAGRRSGERAGERAGRQAGAHAGAIEGRKAARDTAYRTSKRIATDVANDAGRRSGERAGERAGRQAGAHAGAIEGRRAAQDTAYSTSKRIATDVASDAATRVANDRITDFVNIYNRANEPDLHDQMDYFSHQLLPQDVQKANELMPTLMAVNFTYVDANSGITHRSTGVIGIKAKLYPIDSMDIISRLSAKYTDKNTLFNFIKASTSEISFFRDFLFAIDKAKFDAINVSRNDNSSKIFKLLERRATKNKFSTLLKKNDASPITSLVISQDEVEYLKKYNNIDMEKSNITKTIMEAYNLMNITIADESLEIAKFLYDDGDGIFEALSFDGLEKESKDSSYKKIVNLMSKINR